MSDTKHTPGPWRIGAQNDSEYLGPPGEIAIMAEVTKGQRVGPKQIEAVRSGRHCVCIVSPTGNRGDKYPELTAAKARFIAASPGHALLLRLIAAGKARWEPFSGGPGDRGEVCIGGLRYATCLDEFGCPEVHEVLWAALERAEG